MEYKETKQDKQEGLKLIEVLENLDNVLKHIYQKIVTIEGKIIKIEDSLNPSNPPIQSDILNIPKLNSMGNPSNVPLTKKSELTKFDRDALTKLYHSVEDEWSKGMIDNILRSKYNTLTEKQLAKINEIATGVGFNESIISS